MSLRRSGLTLILLSAITLSSPFMAAADPASDVVLTNVRVLDERVAASLHDGIRMSQTLRSLLDEVEASDVIVHVSAGARRLSGGHGTMRFVGAAGGYRFLRVTVDVGLRSWSRMAIIAHELQHAVEVVRAPEVVDQKTFARLYERIGASGCSVATDLLCYETTAARDVYLRVFAEVRHASLAAEHADTP